MEHLKKFEDYSINEDTSATGGPAGVVSGGGMVNSQPSSLPGVTVNPAYANSGGKDGSGDASFPYNAGTGKANVFQKAPVGKTKEHSSRKEPKSRAGVAKAALKNILFKKDQDYTSGEGEVKQPKVMNFSDFEKKTDIITVKK